MQSAKIALQIKTSKAELSFINTSYVYCKLLVASSMMSKVDLAVAYIRKAMLALSNYPKLQLKLAYGFAKIPTTGSKFTLALVKEFAVVTDEDHDLF